MLAELVVDRCSEREEPAWGPDGAVTVVPGRRRVVDFEASLLSSDGCDGLRCLNRLDDGSLIVLPSDCCSCLMFEASRRLLESLGLDIAD
jgi:hypothetical protein